MCHLDDTYHVPCGHWGRRTIARRCAIGSYLMSEVGCWNSTTDGMRRVEELCGPCRARRTLWKAEEGQSKVSTEDIGGGVAGDDGAKRESAIEFVERMRRIGRSDRGRGFVEVEVVVERDENEKGTAPHPNGLANAMKTYGAIVRETIGGGGIWLLRLTPVAESEYPKDKGKGKEPESETEHTNLKSGEIVSQEEQEDADDKEQKRARRKAKAARRREKGKGQEGEDENIDSDDDEVKEEEGEEEAEAEKPHNERSDTAGFEGEWMGFEHEWI